MSSAAARARLFAIALAIVGAAACDAASVDLGNDFHPRAPGVDDDAGHAADAGNSVAGGGGSATNGNGSGSGGAVAVPVMPHDAGSAVEMDAAITADAGVDAGGVGSDAGACEEALADCDDDEGNGCEIDLDTDVAHCGSCDRACPAFGFMSFGSTCVAGKCVLTCEAPHADCDSEPDNGCEADLRYGTSADSNCGACGVVCDCNNGTCN